MHNSMGQPGRCNGSSKRQQLMPAARQEAHVHLQEGLRVNVSLLEGSRHEQIKQAFGFEEPVQALFCGRGKLHAAF